MTTWDLFVTSIFRYRWHKRLIAMLNQFYQSFLLSIIDRQVWIDSLITLWCLKRIFLPIHIIDAEITIYTYWTNLIINNKRYSMDKNREENHIKGILPSIFTLNFLFIFIWFLLWNMKKVINKYPFTCLSYPLEWFKLTCRW